MDYLSELENESIFIIREAAYKFKKIGTLWSIGKDSTVMMWLIRKALFGFGTLPVVHIDTTYKFDQMIKFRDSKAKEWGLNLYIEKNELALSEGMGPQEGKFTCCNALKTLPLKNAIQKHGFEAVFVGIRRDEHGVRAKERVFSPRDENFSWDFSNQPNEMWNSFSSSNRVNTHVRVHPIINWREIDIWSYVKREQIPFVEIYQSEAGRRFRSIGCETCSSSVPSNAHSIDEIIQEVSNTRTSERAGRAQDKESAENMQKLRTLGYL